MINKKQLKKIKAFAIDLDWNSAFGGKSKGNRHLFRMQKHIKILSSDIALRRDILCAGAWLHDTNLEKTISGSTLANRDKVITFLKNIGINSEDIEHIIHCISSHDGRIEAQTIEAKIIHDADTLEKSGPLGVIRETWKKSQEGWNTERIVRHLRRHIEKRTNKLYTEKAKKIAKRNNISLSEFFTMLTRQVQK
ncbi:MAG: HD domain-containing protein [Candidatus Woesearchaeota archaeon]